MAARQTSDTLGAQRELGVGSRLPKLNRRDAGPRWAAYVMALAICDDYDGGTMKMFRQVITHNKTQNPGLSPLPPPPPPPESLIPSY